MMKTAAMILAAVLLATPASGRDKATWQVTKSTDPITGKQSCVVAAYDRAAGMSFTRFGAIYPIVEMNSDHGLLVGVSSGGRVRMPTGDILWRVDDLPHRELKAADNPTNMPSAIPGALPADALAKMTQETLALTRSLTATSTVVSGDRAWAMLDELRKGSGLQFRQAAAATGYGLPQQASQETGQITKKGLKPYPLDESFHKGLAACGIGDRPSAASVPQP